MDKTIKCPHCGTEFQIDESNYNELLTHIRNEEFEVELKSRLEIERRLNEEKINNIKNVESNKSKEEINSLNLKINELTNNINLLKESKDNEVNQTKAKLEKQISDLQGVINGEKDRLALAVKTAKEDSERKILELQNQVNGEKDRLALEINKITSEKDQEILKLKNTVDTEKDRVALAIKTAKEESERKILELENKVSGEKDRVALEVNNAVNAKEKEISELTFKLQEAEKDQIVNETKLKEQFEKDLQAKDDLISYYKDLKTKMSTKMIGESLEQHCSNSFNSLRATAFQRAYFEKDNDVSSSGSKGDFIYRDYDENGTEIISIMFEMKNEMDTTATKHKNEDFFKELDKDREEKGCEYAVLVSLLENESDLYNQGIVDVSYRYKKMYVIRPQFFIPLITLLKNASMNAAEYKHEIQVIKNQQIDVYNFENNLNEYKEYVENNYRMAKDKFDSAITEIEKTIEHLQKVKKALEGSSNNLRLAASKGDSVTIKKLTKNAPSVAAKFDAIDNEVK